MRAGSGFVLGILVTLVVLFCGAWLYLKFGNPPVAVSDKPFPFEAQIVHVPLKARVQRNLQQPPFAPDDQVYDAGAQVYAQNCAMCHGTPDHNADIAPWMYPSAPQLWKKHSRGNVVGVSDDKPGETYWKVKNGIRLTGMPAFEHLLSEDQMWDVSLLLANADKPLSPQVQTTLATAK